MNMDPIAQKMSQLTLVSGKVTRYDSVDRPERHLDKHDYSNLITQRLRPTDSFSVIRSGQSNLTPIPRNLPKTFVTKSRSLFLYSDGNIIKNRTKLSPASVAPCTFSVNGSNVASPALRENAPNWKRFTLPKRHKLNAQKIRGSEERRDDIMYIRGFSRSVGGRQRGTSYSWNYTKTSVRKPNVRQDVTKETIKGLSDALLGYQTMRGVHRLRYENRIMNAVTEQSGAGETEGGPETEAFQLGSRLGEFCRKCPKCRGQLGNTIPRKQVPGAAKRPNRLDPLR